MTIKVMSVHHIMFTVGDIEIADSFYKNILGLEVAECPVKDGRRIWYKLGKQELHVNLHKNYKAGLSHVAVSIEKSEYHKYYEQVKNTGYEKMTESQLYKEDGLSRFYIDDPFGNTVEVTDGEI
jgi:catechol 2,3-dioxygenase-like lactoylglutathione lyase family enzyme